MERFHVRIAGDELVFSAAHFVTLAGDECEGIHGHDYHVAAEVHGPLGDNHYVVDFLTVRKMLRAIIGRLDHRMLLPAGHPSIHIVTGDREIEARFADRRWVLPQSDCLLLPIANTTTELLAGYVARRLLEELQAAGEGSPASVRIELTEGGGFSAACEIG